VSPPEAQEAKMGARSSTQELEHAQAVQDIARLRFPFPTSGRPYLKTYTNHPQRTMGVRTPRRTVVYPDIVVVRHPENETVMLGEVETADTVNEDEAHEWKLFAELAPLYLYVPVGYADEARRLCKKLKIPIVGLRSWRYLQGQQRLEINDVFTQWTGLEDLAPEPIKGFLKRYLEFREREMAR
jgi:hypothetical protein